MLSSMSMALKAHVKNGQIVLDEPAELAEGMAVSVYLCDSTGDTLSDEERAALHRSIRRGLVQAEAGELIDADDVLAELERWAVIVRFAPEALDAIRKKRAWWEAHRDKAPELFRDELRIAVTKLRTAPTEGKR
jgi:predicted transcriptional regulator